MSRSYHGVRPHKHRVYSVDDVMALYKVCRNTVSNWVASGLDPSDRGQPYVFRGADLIRFHQVCAPKKQSLPPGAFQCLRCKARVAPTLSTIRIAPQKPGVFVANATCPNCAASMTKLLGETEYDKLRSALETNTSLGSIVEDYTRAQACIGKDKGIAPDRLSRANDRLLYSWIKYAGRYDPKTVNAHLISIRAFEVFVGGKPFVDLTREDAAAWRDHIIRSRGDDLSLGTLRQRVSHLRLFFGWLSKQPHYAHLAALPDYVVLPRRFQAKSETVPRAFPTIDEAAEMLDRMSSATLKDRRARALFAFAFISGFRADALTTVRLHHVDMTGHRVRHDGKLMRTKNGKSFISNWFPRTEPFRQVFEDWVMEIEELGLGPDDALFPGLRALSQARTPNREPIPPMASAAAVTEAFRLASSDAARRYSPHAARHTLVHLGDQICRTSEERKAWSLNLGHSSEAVTWTHYGKVNDERKDAIFEAFEDNAPTTSDEISLMLAYHEHQLVRGTPEFTRAEALVENRRDMQRQRKR